MSGGFESCIVYASRTTAKVAVTRQEGASLRRWSAEVVAGQGAGEQSQTQTGGRVPGVKGSQVQILSARPKKLQVRGRFLYQGGGLLPCQATSAHLFRTPFEASE